MSHSGPMDVTLQCKVVVATSADDGESNESKVLVDVANQTTLAYLLAESHLPLAESRFQKTWESLVAEPVQVQFAEAVRALMESIRKREVEAEMAVELPQSHASMFLETRIPTNDDEQQQDGGSNPG